MSTDVPKRLPRPGQALVLWAAVLGANLGIGHLFARLGLHEDLLLLVTPALVLTLTGMAAAILRTDVKETFRLRWPSRFDLMMAFPLAISFVVLSDQLSSLTEQVFPIPPELREALVRTVTAEGPAQWIVKILGIAVGAAVSEELLCRGFILSALARRGSRTYAIVWTSVLFMLLHVLPLPSFAAAGLVLGTVALATRSIVIPIVIHATNNAAALALMNLAGLETLGDPIWIPPTILVPALAIFVLTMGYFLRRLTLAALAEDARRPRPSAESRADDAYADAANEGAPISLPQSSMRLSDELAGVPPQRRRLGWLVTAAAVVGGTLVLLGLFVFSVLASFPREHQAALIEQVRARSLEQLAPEARGRADELDSAFDALDAVNDAGALQWRHVAGVAMTFARATSDGGLENEDVDRLVTAIRDVVAATAAPRRL